MMKTIHLHIGMHKTGTSAFQGACDRERDALSAAGFNYHRDDLTSNPNHSYFRNIERGDARILPAIRASFEANELGNYIISGEELSYMRPQDLHKLAEVFGRFFQSVKVYSVLRPPISYMHSAAQQILKDPRSTVRSLRDRWDVTPSYERRLQKFIDLFGSDNLILLPYGKEAPERLAQAMGIPVSLDFLSENQSVSLWVGKMLSAMKPFRDWAEVERAICILASAEFDQRERFQAPIELVEKWADHIAQDRDWLARNWEAPEGFFDEELPSLRSDYFDNFSAGDIRAAFALAHGISYDGAALLAAPPSPDEYLLPRIA